ncbi:hypothetical protein VTN96DRAFT_7291 [Rasamsonia emersonii]
MEPQACNVQDETLTRNNHDRVQDSKSSYLRCKNEIAWQMVDPFTSAGLAQAQRMSDDSQAVRPSSCHGATPPFLLSAPQEPIRNPLITVILLLLVVIPPPLVVANPEVLTSP